LKWQNEISQKYIHFIHLSETGKLVLSSSRQAQIRISKFETNPNDQNINDQNIKRHRAELLLYVLNFEHFDFDFDIVSDFDIRICGLRLENSTNLNTWCHRSRQSQLTLSAVVAKATLAKSATWPRGRGFPETNNLHIMVCMAFENRFWAA
jgi:hypothetical protein